MQRVRLLMYMKSPLGQSIRIWFHAKDSKPISLFISPHLKVNEVIARFLSILKKTGGADRYQLACMDTPTVYLDPLKSLSENNVGNETHILCKFATSLRIYV